jgi:hypothetical protein
MDLRLMKRLREVVDAYGANPARWPAEERTALEEASRADPGVLAEADEIDRVLALAAMPRGAADAQSRLLRTIANDKGRATDTVIPMPARRRAVRSPAWSWAAAAALAASLACGIYLGSLDSVSGLFDPNAAASDDPVDLAGLGDLSDYIEGEG